MKLLLFTEAKWGYLYVCYYFVFSVKDYGCYAARCFLGPPEVPRVVLMLEDSCTLKTGRRETQRIQKCGWIDEDTIAGDGWAYNKTKPRRPKMYYNQSGPLYSLSCALHNYFFTPKQLQYEFWHATNAQVSNQIARNKF